MAFSGHDTETEHPVLIGCGLWIAGQPPMGEKASLIENSSNDIGVPDVDREQHRGIVLVVGLFRYSRR